MKRSSRIAAVARINILNQTVHTLSIAKVKAQEDRDLNDTSQRNNNVVLARDFYDQDCLSLAKSLLGSVLCRRLDTGEIVRGTIVETEAYPGGDDKASQSYSGKRTPRNEAMFMEPGTAYVYFTYGMYYCFNISSKGEGSAVLIRGVEPLEGLKVMLCNRTSTKKINDNVKSDLKSTRKQLQTHELANGPSKLCIAFHITRDNCNKIDMTSSSDLWIERSKDFHFCNQTFEIVEDKRIGINSTPPEARNKLWRFFVKDSLSESRAKVREIRKRQKMSEEQCNS